MLEKLIFGTILLTSININSQSFQKMNESNKNNLNSIISVQNQNVVDYIEDNYDNILNEFNSFYGIDLKKVNYKIKNSNVNSKNLMEYDLIKKIININNGKNYFINESSSFFDLDSKNHNYLKGTLIHELAHVYTDQKLSNLLKRKKISPYSNKIYKERPINELILWEGIAEYSGIEMGQLVPFKFDKKEIKTNKDIYENIYGYGYIFVKPILDILGFEKGIEVILTERKPNNEELYNPKLYKKRIIGK